MADRYWVGGNGQWNTTNTTNWSETSGGAGGASIPTSADNVYFDENSAAGNYTVSTSIGLTLNALNLSIVKPAAGTVTFTDTGIFDIAGSVDIISTGVTWNAFGSWTLTSSTAQTINADGILLNTITLNGAGGGSWQLLSNLSTRLTNTVALTAGTLDLNNFNLTCGAFSSNNSNTRSLLFGTGVVNLTGSAIVWQNSTTANFTMTGSRVINLVTAATTGIREVQVGPWDATTAPNVNVTAGSARVVLTGSFNNLNTTGYTGRIDAGTRTIYGDLTLGAGSTVAATITSVTTFAPTARTSVVTTNGVLVDWVTTIDGTGVLQLADDFSNSSAAGTMTLTNGRLDLNNNVLSVRSFSSANTNVRGIDFGTGRIEIIGNAATVWLTNTDTNLTYTGSRDVRFVYAGASGTRTIQVASTFNITDSGINISVTAGTDTVTITGQSGVAAIDLDFTGFSGTTTIGTGAIRGNLTLSPTMTLSPATGSLRFEALPGGTQTITTNGKALECPINITCPGATVILADVLVLGTATRRQLTVTAGTLNINDQQVTCFSVVSTGASAKTYAFGSSGSITLTGNNATIVAFATGQTNMTVTGTAVINCDYAGSVGTRTITLGVLSLANSFSLNITAGTDLVDITTNIRNLDFTGFSGTLINATRTIFGNLTLSPTMSLGAGTAITTFGSSGGTKTVTTAGLTVDFPVTFDDPTGTFELTDNWTGGSLSTSTIRLTSGILDLNDFDINVFGFLSTSGVIRTIDFGTSSEINLTGNDAAIWNFTDVRNFSYTGTSARVNAVYAGSTGTRTLAHGASIGGTSATAAPPMYITAGSDIVTTTATSHFSDLIFTGSSVTVTATSRIIYGDFVYSATNIMGGLVGTGITTFAGNGTQTFDTADLTVDFPIVIGLGSSAGTVQLANELTMLATRTLTLNSGTLDLQDNPLTTGAFLSSGSLTRALDISNSTVTLSGTGIIWDTLFTGGLTANVDNSTVIISDNSTASKTIRFGTLPELHNVVIGGDTSTCNTNFSSTGNIAINSITSTKTVAQTIGMNGSFAVNSWGIVGTAAAPITLNDAGFAVQANLNYTGTGIVSVEHYTISYSNASPNGKWFALTSNDNIDAGNNSGWIFDTSRFFLTFR
jgi:hypothetical protein